MSTVVQAEKAGAKIVDWYSCIISRSIDQAILLKEQASALVKNMEPNDKILAYYSLVEFRHEMLLRQNAGMEEEERFSKIEPILENTVDHLLKYLYYFISGQNEYINERYKSAIKLFRKAERLLEYVDDDAEEAEFYYYAGAVCYRLNQYPFATSYVEQAKTIFDSLGYVDKVNCQIIIAATNSEVGKYEKADEILKNALQQAEMHLETKALILRTLGLNAIRKREWEEAEHYFKSALAIKEHRQSPVSMKSQYNLANVLFRLQRDLEAREFFKKAEVGILYYRNTEYSARSLVTKGLYIENGNLALVNKGIDLLREHSLEFEIAEVAEETSAYLEKAGKSQEALKYMKVAYEAKLNQNALGVDQE
ncbi:tetratricopeptide repeat protein [Shouchella clausii]|uniref:response regulator aspartate phosphatase n=1 Tax=Shouchella clausii TaxID=79880 RepID=UPI0031835D9F